MSPYLPPTTVITIPSRRLDKEEVKKPEIAGDRDGNPSGESPRGDRKNGDAEHPLLRPPPKQGRRV